MRTDAYYFGCHRRPGHFLWTPGMQEASSLVERRLPIPLQPNVLDTGYAPLGPEIEGLALLHRVHAWTVLAFWDRSVDTRGKCNSAFLFRPNTLTFEQVVEHAKVIFPEVWGRFTFSVVLAEVGR